MKLSSFTGSADNLMTAEPTSLFSCTTLSPVVLGSWAGNFRFSSACLDPAAVLPLGGCTVIDFQSIVLLVFSDSRLWSATLETRQLDVCRWVCSVFPEAKTSLQIQYDRGGAETILVATLNLLVSSDKISKPVSPSLIRNMLQSVLCRPIRV